MKILNLGLNLQPGKTKYVNEGFKKLVAKFKPKKETPYAIEIVENEFDKCDAVLYQTQKKLDLIVIDLEKIETRLNRTTDEKEKEVLLKAQKLLEAETLLCDTQLSPDEENILKALMLVSLKPSLAAEDSDELNELIKKVIEKSGTILFFTAGEKEVHIWSVLRGNNARTAAGRIHSDLARGFIKADIVNATELDNFHNMAEARSRGMVKVVDSDYVMQDGDIIEVRFNV